MAAIAVNISVPDTGPATQRKLAAAGLKNANVLEAVGLITGEVDEANYKSLAALPGITVERADRVHIAPPDAPVQ